MDELPPEQIEGLKKAFQAFDHEKKGYITIDTVDTILDMLGIKLDAETLQEVYEELEADGSGQLGFDEFVILAARFLVEEDAEAMQEELREAFRLYDKEEFMEVMTGE